MAIRNSRQADNEDLKEKKYPDSLNPPPKCYQLGTLRRISPQVEPAGTNAFEGVDNDKGRRASVLEDGNRVFAESDTERKGICGRMVDIVDGMAVPEMERREMRRAGTKIRGTVSIPPCLCGTHSKGGRASGEEMAGAK